MISTASSTFSRQSGDSIETVDRRGQLALVDAARTAGVDHFVFISYRDNPDSVPVDRGRARRRAGAEGVRDGVTILQASYFMEIWLTPISASIPKRQGPAVRRRSPADQLGLVCRRCPRRGLGRDRPAARNMIVDPAAPRRSARAKW